MLNSISDIVFSPEKSIGEGAYSRVTKCWFKDNPTPFALKIVFSSDPPRKPFDG